MSKELVIEFQDNDLLPYLFGECNDHLSYIEKKLSVHISNRGNVIGIDGAKANANDAKIILKSLYTRLKDKELANITYANIDSEIRFLKSGSDKTRKSKKHTENDISTKNKVITTKNKTIAPRSPNQAKYLELINKHDMVFISKKKL